ncbi:LysR family transcriptional regulator [Chitinimonas arctica]|uniref:LysR family transcriptional regulator n=1 Tax=Chitinimonas arctica TaxID=2594795 RepID=A0A516SBI9_9NEIS|nr:LysR family transcriptional regulator [Chitinimonas arctica]QDQ25510.1 LysR family transcriptional regulator [Chitinimonas arctica]
MERFSQRVAGLEEFVRVAEARSFVRAAESLNLSTSGIAKAIRQLEARLGVRLLNRTTRQVSLTDDGATFYARAKQLLSDYADAEAELSAKEALRGLIRIEMPVVYGRLLFLPHLVKFLDRHPALRVDVRMSDHFVDLVAEGADLALRVGTLDSSDLVARPLGHVHLGTYAAPDYLARHGQPSHPDELAGHRLLAYTYPSGRVRKLLYQQAGKPMLIDALDAVALFNNGEAWTDAAMAGLGIAQLPTFHASAGVAAGKLVPILQGWDATDIPIHLVYPSRRYLPARVKALIDFVLNEVSRVE